MENLISIVMACYNGESFVEEQIDSILRQTYGNFELLLCDDCSKDNTYALLCGYLTKDVRVKLFRNEINLGFKNTFQKMLLQTQGEYVALCDQDDVWSENHLEILLNGIDNFDLVGANSELVNAYLEPIGTTMLESFKVEFLPQFQMEWFLNLLHMNVFQGTACMFKKDLISKVLPIPDSIIFHDRWFAIIATMFGGVNYIDKSILRYRQHGNNVTKNKKWSFFNKIRECLNKKNELKDFIEKQLLFLNEIQMIAENQQYIDLINETRNFYLSMKNRKLIHVIKYYNKYYEYMYLSKSKILKIIRILKRLFNL